MATIQTYLETALQANASYANLSKLSTANNYMDELYGNTQKNIKGQNFTLEEAKDFAK